MLTLGRSRNEDNAGVFTPPSYLLNGGNQPEFEIEKWHILVNRYISLVSEKLRNQEYSDEHRSSVIVSQNSYGNMRVSFGGKLAIERNNNKSYLDFSGDTPQDIIYMGMKFSCKQKEDIEYANMEKEQISSMTENCVNTKQPEVVNPVPFIPSNNNLVASSPNAPKEEEKKQLLGAVKPVADASTKKEELPSMPENFGKAKQPETVNLIPVNPSNLVASLPNAPKGEEEKKQLLGAAKLVADAVKQMLDNVSSNTKEEIYPQVLISKETSSPNLSSMQRIQAIAINLAKSMNAMSTSLKSNPTPVASVMYPNTISGSESGAVSNLVETPGQSTISVDGQTPLNE